MRKVMAMGLVAVMLFSAFYVIGGAMAQYFPTSTRSTFDPLNNSDAYQDPDNDGQFEPAPLAKVKLDEHPLLPDTKPKTLTDSWGYFKFEDVEPGEHVIWGSKEGQGSAYYIGKRKVYLEKRGNAYVELKLHAWP